MAPRQQQPVKLPQSHEDTFRRLALSLPHAVESTHMGAPDFRLNGRIFATLAYRVRGLGTLKLTPGQQASFLEELPACTEPAPGGWGRMGMTLIRLDAPEAVLQGALSTAYRNVEAAQQQVVTRQRSRKPTAPLPPANRPRRLQ